MKRAAQVLLFLVFSCWLPGDSSPAFVQDCFSESAAAVTTLTCTMTVTAGDGLFVGVVGANGVSQTVTDDKSDTFTGCPTLASGDSFPVNNTSPSATYTCWYVKKAVGGSTIFTITYGSLSAFSAFNPAQMHGQSSSTFFDNGSRGHGNGSGDLSSGNFTVKAADFLYVFGNKNAVGGLGAGTGFTLLRKGTLTGWGSAYKLLTGSGTTAGLLNNGTAVDYDVFGVAALPFIPRMLILGTP